MANRLTGNLFIGQQGFAAGGSGTVLTVDLSALPNWPSVAPDNLGIGVRAQLQGKTSSNNVYDGSLAATCKRIAGVLSRPGAPVNGYVFSEADIAAALMTLTVSGNQILLGIDCTSVLFTTQWTGYIWLTGTQY